MMSEVAIKNGATNAPLDDVMIAMDVVDMLRHDQALVERELNNETRRKDLIDRLKTIYHGQGIEVPDHILEDGVKALEEERFTYKPPPPDALNTRLARAYVSRGTWGRYVGGAAIAIAVLWGANHLLIQRPKLVREAQLAHELQTRLPTAIKKLGSDVASETKDKAVVEKAQSLVQLGLNAVSSRRIADAKATEASLSEMLDALRATYQIRIVNRRGEVTGLWRIPKRNPNALNYYLVVEAIDARGGRLEQWITNEETGQRERVRTWAIRVDKQVFDRVAADKNDDGIIQNNVAGVKELGKLEPTWKMNTLGGAITKWN